MHPLDVVAPGLWRFAANRNGIPPTMTGYALRDGEDTILVDPLVAGETEALLAALDEILQETIRNSDKLEQLKGELGAGGTSNE